MIRKSKNLREIVKAKIAESGGINKNLHHADLFGVLSRVGKEKSLSREIYKIALYMDAIFGPDYAIETTKRLTGSPKKYGFHFPTTLGKRYAIKYFSILFNATEDKKYLEAIKTYETSDDPHVSDTAKQILQEMKGGNE